MTRLILRSQPTRETRIILRLADLSKAKQAPGAGQLGLFGTGGAAAEHVNVVPHGHHLKLVEVKAHDRHTKDGLVHVDSHRRLVEVATDAAPPPKPAPSQPAAAAATHHYGLRRPPEYTALRGFVSHEPHPEFAGGVVGFAGPLPDATVVSHGIVPIATADDEKWVSDHAFEAINNDPADKEAILKAVADGYPKAALVDVAETIRTYQGRNGMHPAKHYTKTAEELAPAVLQRLQEAGKPGSGPP